MFKIVKVHFRFFDRTTPPKNSINLTYPAARCPHSIKSRAHDMRHNLCVAQGHDGQMLQLRPATENWSHPPVNNVGQDQLNYDARTMMFSL